MHTVHKFAVPHIGEVFEIRGGPSFTPLTMMKQGESHQMWAEVETQEDPIWPYLFIVVGTGHFIPPGFDWIATTQEGPFVWHLYGVRK